MYTVTSPPFHAEVSTLLLNPAIRFLNLIAPRGTAKSSLVAAVYVLYHVMFDEGKKVIVIASKTQAQAVLLLQTIKDILDYSEQFRVVFGYWGKQSAIKWSNHQIVLKDKTFITCLGTGQQVRGIKYGNQRPTLIVVDDPEDEANTRTKEAMESNLKWLLQAVEKAIDQKKGRVVVVGTPQHERCIVFTLRDNPMWVTRQYKYLNEVEGEQVSLWPEMKTVKELEDEKAAYEAMGRVSYWYRERQCEVTADEHQIFVKEMFRWYEGYVERIGSHSYLHLTELDGVKCDTLMPVNIFMGVDPASTMNDWSDFTAIVPTAMNKKRERFILDYVERRMTPMVVAETVLAKYNELKPVRTTIETNGYQEMLRDYLNMTQRIPGAESGERTRDKKEKRYIDGIQPYFAQRQVFVKKSMQSLIDQFLLYPRSKHDDLLDGTYLSFKRNFPPFHETPSDKDENVDTEIFSTVEQWVTA